MLDIKFIRENPDAVKKACELKGMTDYTDEILKLDARVRELKTITQSKTAEKNKITREIPTATDRAPLIAKSKEIANEIAADMAELAEREAELDDLLHRVPHPSGTGSSSLYPLHGRSIYRMSLRLFR